MASIMYVPHMILHSSRRPCKVTHKHSDKAHVAAHTRPAYNHTRPHCTAIRLPSMNRINTEYSNSERRKSAAIAIENERVQKEIIRQKQGEMLYEALTMFVLCYCTPIMFESGTHMVLFVDGTFLY